MQKFDFIQINNTILDYSEYVKNVIILKTYLKHRFIELLLEEGFSLEEETSRTYSNLEVLFYNKDEDIEVKIKVSKRNKEDFV
jgi:hypothetical protein